MVEQSEPQSREGIIWAEFARLKVVALQTMNFNDGQAAGRKWAEFLALYERGDK